MRPRPERGILPLADARPSFAGLDGPETSITGAKLIERLIGTEPESVSGVANHLLRSRRDEALHRCVERRDFAARSDTSRFFDFVGAHIMDWTQRDRINSWWLLLFGIGGTVIALSGFVLLANRFPKLRRRKVR